MNRLFFALLIASIHPSPAKVGEWRPIRDDQGSSLMVRFEGIRDDRYLLRRQNDGRLFEVAPGLLPDGDRERFRAEARELSTELAKLAQTVGKPLFAGTPFEVRDAREIAKALGLPVESKTRHSTSWRLYARPDYKLFGTRPYSVALYADEQGHPTNLSAVFANKGDFGSTAGMGADHFEGGSEATIKSLAEAMENDERAIEKAISSALGEAETQRYGEGKSRRTVRRWDWNGHSLLLSSEENEYVSLSIVPLELAESGGKTGKVADMDLKKRLASDVKREKNGDVYLSQIPMVNQGPKGYCVPATFERAMRTMGIDADMYLLAMIGETSIGGGTSVGKLLENVRSQVYRKGRRPKDERTKKLRIRDVQKYIDDGIPVIWAMRSLDEYNQIANNNTKRRRNVTDWNAWATTIAEENEALIETERVESNHHICMIVGYNEATQEFAVSDSWGPSYERRWVPVAVADWASQGGIFMILP
ncbi:C39 family peptidase [Haloferula chungangensis]|uniref:C39 family peptidase n=1 Tax=Haloferula chungangensis TaxID=1048331 RepID=A0ABW2LDH8_9BACT